QAQLGTECGTMDQMKVGGPPFLRIVIAFGEHGDRHRIPGLHDRFKLPGLCAHESMRRRLGIVRFVRKPGETDGYAATNGATGLPARLGTDEKHFLRTARLPGSYVRSVQVHLTSSVAGGDGHFGQAAVPRDDFGDAWNSEPAIQLGNGFEIHAGTPTGLLTTIPSSPVVLSRPPRLAPARSRTSSEAP